MGFWLFMELMLLLTPFVMIFFGRKFKNNPPDKINWIYGYRTKMSMKNKDTWNFAHEKMGNLWFKIGIIMAIISTVCMLPIIGKDSQMVGNVGGIIMAIQIVFLMIPIFFVEMSLKKNFDKDGNRRNRDCS